MTTTTPAFSRTDHQRRLQNAVKRLVIELGYMEHCLAAGLQDANLRTAASGIDSAIDYVNEHLASYYQSCSAQLGPWTLPIEVGEGQP